MARKKSQEQIIKEGLNQLAFGKVTDPISLLFMTEEEILEKLPRLNLLNISEIKRPKGGGMEIKFFDRIKAFEKLSSIDNEGKGSELGFYDALEESAKNLSVGDNDEI